MTNQIIRITVFSAQRSLYTNHDYKKLYLKLVIGLSCEFHSFSNQLIKNLYHFLAHRVFLFAGTDVRQTNNNLRLAQLRDVFDYSIKEKYRCFQRLLILNSHISHVTIEFINYYSKNRILLASFPPYSTYSLQLLNIVMFSPL